MSRLPPLMLEMKNAAVLHEQNDAVVWVSDQMAEHLSGYGENVYTVNIEVDPRSGSDVFVIECPCWYDEKGKFLLVVNKCSVEQAVIAADKAVRFLGDTI